MQKKINLQDLFLLRLRQERLPVTVFLMIYKHAISTVVPLRPVALRESEEEAAL